jgi:hypothetical protein
MRIAIAMTAGQVVLWMTHKLLLRRRRSRSSSSSNRSKKSHLPPLETAQKAAAVGGRNNKQHGIASPLRAVGGIVQSVAAV